MYPQAHQFARQQVVWNSQRQSDIVDRGEKGHEDNMLKNMMNDSSCSLAMLMRETISIACHQTLYSIIKGVVKFKKYKSRSLGCFNMKFFLFILKSKQIGSKMGLG